MTPRAAGRIAVFEIFGDRVDSGLEEFGQEKQRDDDQGDGRHPFIAGHGQAGRARALAGHADEMLGRDVGRDQRKPDQRPDQAAAGQEEILARIFPCGSCTCSRR